MKIAVVVGTRPEIIKMAPVLLALEHDHESPGVRIQQQPVRMPRVPQIDAGYFDAYRQAFSIWVTRRLDLVEQAPSAIRAAING